MNESQLLYQITVDQPDTYSTPYTREFILDYTPDPIYEYACHEGNYSMTNILSGAREQERLAAERQLKTYLTLEELRSPILRVQ